MPDVPSPQDVSADKPVTEVDQENAPTPQGRADDDTDVRDVSAPRPSGDDGDTDLPDASA